MIGLALAITEQVDKGSIDRRQYMRAIAGNAGCNEAGAVNINGNGNPAKAASKSPSYTHHQPDNRRKGSSGATMNVELDRYEIWQKNFTSGLTLTWNRQTFTPG